MKRNLFRALVLGGLMLFWAGAMSAAVDGAIYTSLFDGATVNANHYDDCRDVYLNGGPQGQSPNGLPDGEYYFQVTDPSGATLLSTTPAFERRVKVVDERIFGRAVGLDPAGYDDGSEIHHLEGVVNPDRGTLAVQLWHFDETPNNGGVYKVWLIPVGDATVEADGITLTFDSSASKTDNFTCEHEDGGGPGSNIVVISGRKYYDANANGVYDGGEDWNTGDGRPVVTIDIAWDGGSDTALTDANGLWFYVFELEEGSTLDFMACEQVPTDYNQTGPVDGDSVSNPDPPVLDPPSATATASGGCWSGTITSLLGLSGLNFGNVDTVTISGEKFYDLNLNGANDDGIPIEGFKIVLEITYPDTSTATVAVYTAADGTWSYELPVGSTVVVCEEPPMGSWVQTAPESICYAFTADEDTEDLDFGNVCLGPGGGHTLGFWSNRNGRRVMGDDGGVGPELAGLSALNLRNADGSHFDPVSYDEFRGWILSATATNMANMLSAQLAAMWLNVEAGFVDGNALVYSACADEFVTINDLMSAANTSLGLYGDTTSPHAERADQECLKNTLDDANNDLNFLQDEPCEVIYPDPV